MSPALNPLAESLNETLEQAAPEVAAMLSPLGRRLYMPKGIISQTAEAKARATRFNATIGIATEGDSPMALPSVIEHFSGLHPRDVLNYAPTAGRESLRDAWSEKHRAENPSLAGKRFGRPVVTSAITHGLSLVGDLFVAPGDLMLLPDKLWGNYRLLYEVRLGAEIRTFPFYRGSGFDTESFANVLADAAREREKLLVLLNFPNNPTGYMPTPDEGRAMVEALHATASGGTRLVVVTDDAYFGLFYHLGAESMTESLFGPLTNLHPNLLALKLDGATKELFVWGLRCGFLTVGPGRADTADTVCEVLDAKLRGAIRGSMSNSPAVSQTVVERALGAASIDVERKQKCELLRARAERVHAVANAPRFRESWSIYPFNSGYFMCLELAGVKAEDVRLRLLDEYQTGVIATGPHDLRVAFSCLEIEDVEPLFDLIHRAVQELRQA